jgi:hypothetical protein
VPIRSEEEEELMLAKRKKSELTTMAQDLLLYQINFV